MDLDLKLRDINIRNKGEFSFWNGDGASQFEI